MLKVNKVTKDSEDLRTVKTLYESAFPKNERIDLNFIQANSESDTEALEMLAVYDGELFVGFVIVLNADDLSHILYFAVDEKLRSKGYGSQILQSVHNSRPGQRFVADVEKPNDKSDNNEQREKRIRFYCRNGYKMTDAGYSWNGEDYVILACNGDVSQEEYMAFWKRYSDILKKVANRKKL